MNTSCFLSGPGIPQTSLHELKKMSGEFFLWPVSGPFVGSVGSVQVSEPENWTEPSDQLLDVNSSVLVLNPCRTQSSGPERRAETGPDEQNCPKDWKKNFTDPQLW